MCSQDVTTKNNDYEGFDQNEKVRRILEDRPMQLQDSTDKKPPSFDFVGLDPGCYPGNTV